MLSEALENRRFFAATVTEGYPGFNGFTAITPTMSSTSPSTR
ncbi:MAG TPA: hypothetical protein VGR35_22790 [Tepidisphaeraceae bacterium]|nr:hypothetical protein [Tepidisphaeraceae bacterium]